MDIKRHCQFIPDKEKEKADGKLRYRIRWNNNIVNFNLGYRVDFDKWSYETQRCKNRTTHGKNKISAAIINRKINEFENAAEKIFNRFCIIEKMPDLVSFKSEFNKTTGRAKKVAQIKDTGFWSVFIEFQNTVGINNNWSTSTYKKFQTLKNHIKGYDKDICLDKIDDKYLQNFISYLSTTPQLRNTTARQQITLFNWFLRWAYKNGYYTGRSHETFKPRLKGTIGSLRPVIYLTWDELQKLYLFRFSSNRLSHVKDVFCFCCFTGLRYSDVAKLRKSDIKGTYFNVVTQKTTDALKIEFNKYSKSIIEKYADVNLAKNKALPVINNVKMNEYLKEIGQLLELNEQIRLVYFREERRHEEVFEKWQLLTTHCGRRTFIVNSLFLGIPAEVVMKWTGHADYKAMTPYIEIVDVLKEREMAKFDKIFPPV